MKCYTIDLYGVDMKRVVTVKVAIHLTGTALGVIEEGGVLVQSLNELRSRMSPSRYSQIQFK